MTRSPRRQSGATAVEFALVLLIFCTFFMGLMDLSRLAYTWTAATEATRAGARYAVVCDDTGAQASVLRRMRVTLPQLTQANVQIDWSPPNCNTINCEGVTVRIVNMEIPWISPIAGVASRPLGWSLPPFSTYLPRESMRSDTHSPTFCSPT